jgi:hypothetical protein
MKKHMNILPYSEKYIASTKVLKTSSLPAEKLFNRLV